MMQQIDSAFEPPSNKCIRKNIDIAYQKGYTRLKTLFKNTCNTTFITTDLLTSHANNGEQIKEYLEFKIEEFGLNKKIICAITDNRSNMKKAIKDMNEELVEIFKPFDDLTTYFSRAQYTTLLVVNLSIKTLKFEYANDDLIKENFNNDNKELLEPQAVTSKL
ncbi:zinc finger bed domain-containing protein 4-like [Gigaspora margarita]|uniref:Zinc finger bed domain-containing protein 4-like n=1 Tax=Gigaspora margarita TaxID=4874 RepID=A0A8H3WY49_GIGMA|nr:zinc finger bed domain-containing protein 4-like [Gigaspora margarita]